MNGLELLADAEVKVCNEALMNGMEYFYAHLILTLNISKTNNEVGAHLMAFMNILFNSQRSRFGEAIPYLKYFVQSNTLYV